MLRIPGHAKRACDGISRRDVMRVGTLSLFGGMTWPRLICASDSASENGTPTGPAKSVILFNLLGGPSQMDMFDPKPLAPVEVRGEFQAISTSVPGLAICEHLPNVARLMHRASLIRTVTHGYNAHNPLPIMTGYTGGDFAQLRVMPTDPPDIGAVCQYLGRGPRDLPGSVCLPCYPGWGESSMYPGIRRPGPYGGYLGRQYDPLFAVCQPTFERKPEIPYYDTVTPYGEPQLPGCDALPQMTADRLDRRRSLLDQVEEQFAAVQRSGAIDRMQAYQQRAFSMLCTSKTRDAFDLSQESEALRDKYGRNLFGSSLLVARRLVERGVPFISVHAENFLPHGSFTYDMHENNFAMLRDNNLPVLDRAWPALVEDLEERGLFDSTLIVVMGEMGRSPKVNSKAGRDHWPQCGFSLLAGGGVREGVVYGESDEHAAYPKNGPVSPADIVATIYERLGIDPHMTVPDLTDRPIAIAHGGEPIRAIMT
ncbi:MAG: DUF1501 domain-containing protein [Planctomycetaceae bacterium]|nr:DUF1501 domain-containing protein [Planctomycetaceae bacterium]